MKIKTIGKKAQASVEYILMIALVAGIVLSLTKFSGVIESKLISWKLGARNQLSGLDQSSSGTYDIDKGMFKQTDITLNSSSSRAGTSGGAGTGTGGKRTSAKGVSGKDGTGEEGAELGGVDANAPERKDQNDQTDTSSGGSARRTNVEETADLESTRRPTQDSDLSVQAGASAGVSKEGVTDEENGSVAEEKEASRSSLIKKRQSGDIQANDKTLAEKDWSIGKFLIILLVLLFFIVIVLKAKQTRD